MFSLPQPSEDVAPQGQGDDNVSVVHIHDSPTDLTHLFSVLYNEPGYNSLGMPKLPFRTMASLLRLATKYDLPHIREEPLSRLEKMFPTSLKEFDALPDIENYLVSNADEGGILFDAVNLLHSERILHLLPMAYYLVCIRPIVSQYFSAILFS
ncbi:hypothetical protein BJ165DRAFT_679008 [Panaeolus papilionaceus]|nr:hypothetical protein BJ165DRAFT_679008 [Panaeolus papilionaceus]